MAKKIHHLDKQQTEFDKIVRNFDSAELRTMVDLMFGYFDYQDRKYWVKKAKHIAKISRVI